MLIWLHTKNLYHRGHELTVLEVTSFFLITTNPVCLIYVKRKKGIFFKKHINFILLILNHPNHSKLGVGNKGIPLILQMTHTKLVTSSYNTGCMPYDGRWPNSALQNEECFYSIYLWMPFQKCAHNGPINSWQYNSCRHL